MCVPQSANLLYKTIRLLGTNWNHNNNNNLHVGLPILRQPLYVDAEAPRRGWMKFTFEFEFFTGQIVD